MNKCKLVFSSGIANAFEWYDYALFGHLASIIGAKFFPNADPANSLLYAFLTFAIGYLMRPIGGIFFGVLGDRYGRKVVLSGSLFLMALPTTLISILPTYDNIGITATILMLFVRILQGLSMGGALIGSISFVIEHTNKKYRGFASSISMSSLCIGLLFGSIISHLIQNFLSQEQFNSWGWRIPFMLGIFILFAAFYIRKYTSETPSFEHIKNTGNVVTSPLKTVILNYWFDILISILINATGSVIFYLHTIYLMSFLKINRGFAESNVSNLANYCYIIMAIITLLTGYLSDIIGRRRIFVINLLIIIFISPLLMKTIEVGNFTVVIISQITLAILAATYIGPEPALQAASYPTNIRNTALSLSYNIGTSIFGGTTPLIVAYLVQRTGHLTSSVYYVIVCAIFSLIALYFYKDRTKFVESIHYL